MPARPPAATDAPAERGTGGAEEPPPILGSWGALYALVVAELLLVIALCYVLSRWGR